MEEEQNISIQNFDDHILFDIMGYLNLRDSINLLQTSKRFHNLQKKEDFLYKNLCLSCYFEGPQIVETKPQGISYKQYFLENIERLNRYKSILNQVINKHVEDPNYNYFKNVQKQKAYVNDQKKLNEILLITKRYYQKIPKDILILYRILNGQSELKETNKEVLNQLGLFGLIQYYSTYFNFMFNPFMKPQCGFLEDLKAHPFSTIDPTGKSLFIDLTNQLGFGHQTIYNFSPFRGQENKLYININHTSIDKFMEQLSRSNWKDDESYNDLFDTLYQPGSDRTTNGIRIRATAKHVPQDQHNNIGSFFYSYSIRISADNMPEGKTYQLKKRKWIIIQDQDPDHPDVVEGPGVIGMYPKIYAGCQDFIYQSCTVMEGYTGNMQGSFYFEELNTKEVIEAKIDPFPLYPDSDSKLICYDLQNQTSQVIFQPNIH